MKEQSIAFTMQVLLAKKRLQPIIKDMVKAGVSESEAKRYLHKVMQEALK